MTEESGKIKRLLASFYSTDLGKRTPGTNKGGQEIVAIELKTTHSTLMGPISRDPLSHVGGMTILPIFQKLSIQEVTKKHQAERIIERGIRS